MEQEILDVINYYCKEVRLVDYEFLSKILEILISYCHIEDYIKSFKLDTTANSKNAAEYIEYSKKIIVYQTGLTKLFELPNKGECFNFTEVILSSYIASISAIAHETSHASISKTILLPSDDLKTTVLKASHKALDPTRLYDIDEVMLLNPEAKRKHYLETLAKMENMLNEYHKYYEFSPEERLAFIEAYKLVLRLLKEIGKKYPLPNLIKLYENKLFAASLRGYDQTLTPTKYYLKKMGVSKLWPEIKDLSHGKSLEVRISLGLNISKKEYQRVLSLK